MKFNRYWGPLTGLVLLLLVSSVSAGVPKKTDFGYTYDEKRNRSEYFEYYVKDGKIVRHGVTLIIENATRQKGATVRVIKEVYVDGVIQSVADKSETLFQESSKGNPNKAESE
ncbi:MAG: hypothetical protein KDN05_01945 [Verrucomicrobiae bacterium]|nr:hypothetical protein [Verrucomicrobiae bacterium]